MFDLQLIALLAILGTMPSLLTGILLPLGIYASLRAKSQTGYGLLGIIAFSILASAAGKYALHDRLTLYLIPVVLFFASYGIAYIIELISQIHQHASIVVIGAILFSLYMKPINLVSNPADFQQMRQALEFIDANNQDDDLIYAFNDSI